MEKEILATSTTMTTDTMTETLKNLTQLAISTLDKAVSSNSVIDHSAADQHLRETLSKEAGLKIRGLTSYVGTISELDLMLSTCKMALSDSCNQLINVSGIIRDPLLEIPDSPYIKAFTGQTKLKVTAKATISDDGQISTLYISDACLIEA